MSSKLYVVAKKRLQEDFTYETFEAKALSEVKDIIDEFNSLDLRGEILVISDEVKKTDLYLGEGKIAFVKNGEWFQTPLKEGQDLYSFLEVILTNPKIGNLQAIEVLLDKKQ